MLVDTAGLRRRTKVAGTVDYYAQLRSERAAERADVALVVCDATEGITSQDLRIAELAMKTRLRDDRGAEQVGPDETTPTSRTPAHRVATKLRLRPEVMTASAKTGRNVARLLLEAIALADRPPEPHPDTPELNRFLSDLQAVRQPPAIRGRRLRIYYGAVRHAPAALRDPGLGPGRVTRDYALLPGEPAAAALRARGRPTGHRLQGQRRDASSE